MVFAKLYLVKMCSIFDGSPLAFGARYQSFLRVCWYLPVGVTNFVYPSEKFNNPTDVSVYVSLLTWKGATYFTKSWGKHRTAISKKFNNASHKTDWNRYTIANDHFTSIASLCCFVSTRVVRGDLTKWLCIICLRLNMYIEWILTLFAAIFRSSLQPWT